MRVVLPFKLDGQTLIKGRSFPKSVADGSKDSVVIKVDGVPDGCVAKGYFKLSWESNTTYDLTFDGDELVVDEYIVTLPSYANNKYIDYKFSFSVAIWEGNVERLTTNPVEVVVEKSNYTDETTNTPEIPESQYDKLARDLSGVIDLTNNLDDDVKTLTEKVGNMDVLVVTEAYDTPLFASHTSREINDHVKSGGSVVLNRGEYYFTLASSTPLEAIFEGTTGDGSRLILWVDVDGKFTSYEYDPTENGADTLVVTYDEDSRMASKNAGEIFQHVSAGGTVVFKRSPGERYVLVHSSEDYATFVCIDDAGYTYVKMIYVDGSLEEYEHDLSSLSYISPLVVTLDDSHDNASHSSTVIYNHVMNGGTAILKEADGDIHSRLFTLTYVDHNVACFSSFGYDPNAECYEVLDDATVNYYEYHFGESGDVSGQVAEAQAAAAAARQSSEEAEGYANTAQQSAADAEESAKWAESCSKSAEGSAERADEAALALMDAASRIPPEYAENDRYFILRVNGNGDGLEFVNIAQDMYLQTWVIPYLLPNVNGSQDGMVLKVVNGKWQLVNAPSGGVGVTVDTTLDATSSNAIANKPVAQAIARLEGSIGDISAVFDELHIYAQNLVNGGNAE